MLGNIGFGAGGYTDTLFSQSMAGFFHESKSAVIDYKYRQELVSKSRVLLTKVPLAKAIIDILSRGVVGSGLHMKDRNETFEVLSSLHMLDTTRQLDFYQLQQQVWQTTLSCGECFLIRNKSEESEFSSWYAVEPDHVQNPPFVVPDTDGFYYYKGHRLIDGIEFKNDGTPWAVHYCINPYFGDFTAKQNWKRIFFNDRNGLANIIHVKLTDRPEYPRGLPIIAPLIETLYSLYAFQQAQIQMGIVQSCQAFVVKTTDANKSMNPFEGMSQADMNSPLVCDNNPEEHKHEPSVDFQIVPPNRSDVMGLVSNPNYIKPGCSYHLGVNESIEHLATTGPSNSLTEYYDLVVRQCGSALGIPPAVLRNEFDASFSASKCSVAQWNYQVSKYTRFFEEQFLKPILRVFLLESGMDAKDAVVESIKSIWKKTEPSILLDEARSMDFMAKGIELGLISRDEAAQKLFGHDAEGQVMMQTEETNNV